MKNKILIVVVVVAGDSLTTERALHQCNPEPANIQPYTYTMYINFHLKRVQCVYTYANHMFFKFTQLVQQLLCKENLYL